MSDLRGEIAHAACSRDAIWLRRCAASWRLVAAIRDQYFFKHFVGTPAGGAAWQPFTRLLVWPGFGQLDAAAMGSRMINR